MQAPFPVQAVKGRRSLYACPLSAERALNLFAQILPELLKGLSGKGNLPQPIPTSIMDVIVG